MKILHISTKARGGAGNAAIQLHLGLLRKNIDSKFFYKAKGVKGVRGLYQYDFPEKNSFLNKFLLRTVYSYKRPETQKKKLRNYSYDRQGFSFPYTNINISNLDILRNADIIHLHWISNFFDYKDFFKNVKTPVVWTLHDRNPLLGGFHYTMDYMKHEREYGKLEEKLKEYKKKWVKEKDNIYIVSPSKAYYKESTNSEIFAGRRHFCIPNSVDLEKFNVRCKKMCREKLDISPSKKIILFVASDISIRWKGIYLLIKALDALNDQNIDCIAVGDGKVPLNKHVNPIGRASSQMLAYLYGAADALVIPSYEDNFPNIVLEALACGTPVIGSSVGGIPDMVIHKENGLLFETGNYLDLADKLKEFFLMSKNNLTRMSSICRTKAEKEFSVEKQTEEYVKIYKQILSME